MILVGDEQQLHPTIICQKCKDFNYGQSLFERLIKVLPEENKLILKMQYRMHPEVSNFIKKFYNQLKTSPTLKQCHYKLHKIYGYLCCYDVDGV